MNHPTSQRHAPIQDILEAQRSAIYDRWKDLLHLDRGISALASPAVLVYMIDQTIDEVLKWLGSAGQVPAGPERAPAARCCGRNPYLAYFGAGRQALREALVMAQAVVPYLDPSERDADLARLDAAYAAIEGKHIGLFCAICQFRPDPGEPAAFEPPGLD